MKSRAPTAKKEANVIRRTTEFVDINASWPIVGIARVDDESRAFVTGLADRFEQEIEALAAEPGVEEIAHLFPYELSISHEATYPSPRVASILWNIWSFTGGAHGMLDIVANNYDRSTGYPLLLEDLFVDPDLAVLPVQQGGPPRSGRTGRGLGGRCGHPRRNAYGRNRTGGRQLPHLHRHPFGHPPCISSPIRWPLGRRAANRGCFAGANCRRPKPNPEFWDAEAPAGETSKP